MKLKATRGLTKAGKRKGRPPKYLTQVDLDHPAHRVGPRLNRRKPQRPVSDTLLRIKLFSPKHQAAASTQYALAYSILTEDSEAKPSPEQVRAMIARIRRVGGEAIDKLLGRSMAQSISRKTQK
ncbi:hypothetical protein FV222_07065 [Methylobacterium sp. WL103]|uniref:hypothetical protein n=1 Tax=Methylobacterium sp. WL103 TaxID=2603891 RepID=UPI0011CB7BB1|nr:hypothetical protein [Methylobacterium sp. WL103]TXN04969.1 hypothetical protein FV222_07065 [Methylobacterium sp. WL103]